MSNFLWDAVAWILARPFIAAWLIARAQRTPYTHITNTEDGSLYMGRWWLFNPYDSERHETRWSWCPISVRVHHIVRPDRDRHLHDHPWNFRTVVLRGHYVEERENRCYFVRGAGTTASLQFGSFHRIAQVSPGGVWTLFITGRYRGTWGFKVQAQKVPYRDYLGAKE